MLISKLYSIYYISINKLYSTFTLYTTKILTNKILHLLRNYSIQNQNLNIPPILLQKRILKILAIKYKLHLLNHLLNLFNLLKPR